jgi:hypothetical protein
MRSLTILESQVGGTQSVTEVLGKDPSDVSVCGLLHGVGSVFALNDSELRVSTAIPKSTKYLRKGCLGDSRAEMLLGRPGGSSARWVVLECWAQG